MGGILSNGLFNTAESEAQRKPSGSDWAAPETVLRTEAVKEPQNGHKEVSRGLLKGCTVCTEGGVRRHEGRLAGWHGASVHIVATGLEERGR